MATKEEYFKEVIYRIEYANKRIYGLENSREDLSSRVKSAIYHLQVALGLLEESKEND